MSQRQDSKQILDIMATNLNIFSIFQLAYYSSETLVGEQFLQLVKHDLG